ncbi:MAG: hypothetical protein VKL39_00040 [Leptolyngbyaceae bacterium]|nr:hypothetical protein [Leptolyngbyaceae bacterium]
MTHEKKPHLRQSSVAFLALLIIPDAQRLAGHPNAEPLAPV